MISVGREFGSGGKAVALELGRVLGITVYDNELLSRAAVQSGLSHTLFETTDERRRLFSIGGGGGLGDPEIFGIQSSVIREIALNGDAIFVGRASDYILRDMNCLSVFVKAPIEFRARAYAEKNGISLKEAEQTVFKKDRARAEYYNFYTFGHWGKAANYDLCVDCSLLGVEKTAELIIDFGKKSGKIV